MESLREVGLVELVRDAKEWDLSEAARNLMGKTDSAYLSSISVQEWIEEKLKAGEALQTAEVADVTGLARKDVTEIFRHLRTLGRAIIDPDGPQRGSNTRWIAP